MSQLSMIAEKSPSFPKAQEYVEWLHQNSKTTLLYGKNNVYVQPILPNGSSLRVPGYLSLHHTLSGRCILKWTPNCVMNGAPPASPTSPYPPPATAAENLENLWQLALSINIDDMVYIHCHLQPDRGCAVVFVARTGVQHPPLHFPVGSHLLAFLSSLENGLLPTGRLQPPLSNFRGFSPPTPPVTPPAVPAGEEAPQSREEASQTREDATQNEGEAPEEDAEAPKEKASSPRTKAARRESGWGTQDADESEEETADFVFRLLFTNVPSHAEVDEDTIQSRPWQPDYTREALQQRCALNAAPKRPQRKFGDSRRRQVLSRAFYGWLALCRHMKTLRQHLRHLLRENRADLNPQLSDKTPEGLTADMWRKLKDAVSERRFAELSAI